MHGELPYGYFSSTTLTAARSGYRPICRWHSCTSEPRHRPLEGAYETHVRAHRAQSSSTPLCQRLNVVMTWWYGLIQIARNPYRPELHYMRGPGPKWYAKHQGRAENGPASASRT